MIECYEVLVNLLKPSIDSLGDTLLSRWLIPLDIIEKLRISSTAADKARVLLDCLTGQVKYNESAYHKFVSILREQGQWTESILEKLTSCYSRALKSSESQIQQESTVPQDVSTVLESVQVSERAKVRVP